MSDGPGRPCVQCGERVSGRAKTCSSECRTARSRALAKARRENREPTGPSTDEAERLTQAILRDELAPVIREALTEEVLEGIQSLVAHVPKAIQAAADDLGSGDPNIRQRAYQEILKRTLGNQSIVPDINSDKQQALEVYFHLPRPNGTREIEDGGIIETKTCDACGTEKALGLFVGSSDRCQACFDEMRDRASKFTGE